MRSLSHVTVCLLLAIAGVAAAQQAAEPASDAGVAVEEARAADASAEPPTEEAAEADGPDEVTVPEEAAAEEAEPAGEAEGGDEEAADEEPAAAGTDWAGLIERAPAFLALTHHAAVHLPIALWLFGALFVLVGVVAPSWRNQVPLACLLGGMVTSVAAAASGWWYAQYEYADEWAWGDMVSGERLAEGIVRHRWLAVALVIASVVLSVIALVSQRKKSRSLGFVWRVGLLLLAAGVSYEGHVGGELIMGEGFLEEAFQEWINPDGE